MAIGWTAGDLVGSRPLLRDHLVIIFPYIYSSFTETYGVCTHVVRPITLNRGKLEVFWRQEHDDSLRGQGRFAVRAVEQESPSQLGTKVVKARLLTSC